jgi:hypothetical protein
MITAVTQKYNVINGTAYDSRTNEEVINVLERARIHNMRVRLFYGDTETGED